MTDSALFIQALEAGDIALLRSVPKAELHTHTGLNGDRDYLEEKTGIHFSPITEPLQSMDEMHSWVDRHMGNTFAGQSGAKTLVEAAFVQASKENIVLLNAGEDVWALGEYYNGDIDLLIKTWNDAREQFAPETRLLFQFGFSRHVPIPLLLEWAEPFFASDVFCSIDLYADEHAQAIESFVPIYRKAEEKKLLLRAHVGEWGTADDVVKAVELLHLREVQHGIAAAESPAAMRFLAENRIRLNICPTSNVLLGRARSLETHPMRRLFDAGVDITISSDDSLLFGRTVSEEYMALYQAGLFSAEELDLLRMNALREL